MAPTTPIKDGAQQGNAAFATISEEERQKLQLQSIRFHSASSHRLPRPFKAASCRLVIGLGRAVAEDDSAVCVEFRRGAAEEASSRLVGASKEKKNDFAVDLLWWLDNAISCIRPMPEELEDFSTPDFTIYNAGQFPCCYYCGYFAWAGEVGDSLTPSLAFLVYAMMCARISFAVLVAYICYLQTGDLEGIEKYRKRTVKHEVSMLIVSLCKSDKVFAVASEDMDTLTFGALRFLRHLMDPKLRLTMDQFIDLCILSDVIIMIALKYDNACVVEYGASAATVPCLCYLDLI
ncbi:hypothetical protein ZIOFF_065980 [Zingiber officinale]|uniref:XPG-I domain-containing protein n=1 Tax=Zingiber officinale TaxID=94328 RepID=A0A8J5KDI2_ZINOF|nr:hypothetical protein ZIOFF_065980 [Zingiber officinale]